MTTPQAAPEIFQIPIAEVDQAILSSEYVPGSPEFEQAVIMHYALKYAEKGWEALVTVNDQFVRVLAIPRLGMDPKDYVLGLLNNGFLEDALPILQALYGMLDDAEIAYNLGICLSELGHVAECIEPLARCTQLEPDHANAWVGLGVAHTRLGHPEAALAALREAVRLNPSNSFAQRNLGAVLMKADRYDEALGHLRQAAEAAPEDPAALFGLAQCLDTLGGDKHKEADHLLKDIIHRFPQHPIAEMARQTRSNIAHARMREATGGAMRMDAVFYLQDALERFADMEPAKVGQLAMEIALLGRKGLEINNPDKHYRLTNLAGEFSGLHLLCLMHAGIRQFDAKAETGTDLDKEYDLARSMSGKAA
jgi:tetratricopeptide (TPR) repeat protein